MRQRSQSASQLNRKRVSRIVQVAFTAVGIEMPHLSVVVNGLFLLTRSDQPLHWHAQASRKGALGFFTYQINKELSLHQLVCKSLYINFLFLCVHLKTHIPAINGYSGWHLDVIATLANKSWTTNLCHTSWTHQFWFIVFLWEFGSFGPLKKSKLLQHSWYKLCCLTSPFQLVAFIGVLGNNFPANTGCRTLIYTVGKYQCWAVIASLKKRELDKIRT